MCIVWRFRFVCLFSCRFFFLIFKFVSCMFYSQWTNNHHVYSRFEIPMCMCVSVWLWWESRLTIHQRECFKKQSAFYSSATWHVCVCARFFQFFLVLVSKDCDRVEIKRDWSEKKTSETREIKSIIGHTHIRIVSPNNGLRSNVKRKRITGTLHGH